MLAVLGTGCASSDGEDGAATEATPSASRASTDRPPAGGAPDGTGSCTAIEVEASSDVAYRDPAPAGTDPSLVSLDLYRPALPAGCPDPPVLVWVHGGGWQVGDKARVRDLPAWAASRGWALVSVNYRLTPAVTFPTHNEDVAAAVGWLLDHGADHGVDPARLALVGHSAGAGIVASVAVDPAYLDAVGHDLADLACAVPLDTEAYDVAAQVERSALYRRAFGDDPAVHADASPLTHVAAGTGIPPFLVATQGRPARLDLSRRFVDSLTRAGVDATFVDANPLDHAGVAEAVGDPDDEVLMPTLDPFLRRCLGGRPGGAG